MAENNNPLGTDLYSAQNAIRAIIAPEEDNAAATDALEAETTEEVVEEAEPSEEMEATGKIIQLSKDLRRSSKSRKMRKVRKTNPSIY